MGKVIEYEFVKQQAPNDWKIVAILNGKDNREFRQDFNKRYARLMEKLKNNSLVGSSSRNHDGEPIK
jgi:uncharacterized UPF0160 family protein